MKLISLESLVSEMLAEEEGNHKALIGLLSDRHDIVTLEQLCQHTAEELQDIDQTLDCSIDFLSYVLTKYGLRLGMSEGEILTYKDCQGYMCAFILDRMRVADVKDGTLHFYDSEIDPEECEGDDDECDDDTLEKKTLHFHIHHHEKQSEAVTKPIDWDERLYEIAREEFHHQNRSLTCDETRAVRAINAAETFLNALKAFKPQNNEEQKDGE